MGHVVSPGNVCLFLSWTALHLMETGKVAEKYVIMIVRLLVALTATIAIMGSRIKFGLQVAPVRVG